MAPERREPPRRERLRNGRRRPAPPRTPAERDEWRRDRANSGAPAWWPQSSLWLWRWFVRPVLRLLERFLRFVFDGL